jgi:hypothetical protein
MYGGYLFSSDVPAVVAGYFCCCRFLKWAACYTRLDIHIYLGVAYAGKIENCCMRNSIDNHISVSEIARLPDIYYIRDERNQDILGTSILMLHE